MCIRMRRKSLNHKPEQQHPPSASSPSRPVQVFVADGHEVVRAGLCRLLEGEPDVEVVGEADNAKAVLSESRRTKPDVVLLEFGLSSGLEFDLYKTLFHVLPSVRIISLLKDGDTETFRNAVEAGAQGYLRENTDRLELIRAIRTVAKGGSYLGPETADQTVRLLRGREYSDCSPSALPILSPQERRVIALIAEGDTNKEIAAKLVLSERTVKNYITSMFAKLEIERRAQAAALYLKTQYQSSMREEMSA